MKKQNPELIDKENPEWTEESFELAHPAKEVLPEIFGEKVGTEVLKRKRGQRGAQKTNQEIRDSPL